MPSLSALPALPFVITLEHALLLSLLMTCAALPLSPLPLHPRSLCNTQPAFASSNPVAQTDVTLELGSDPL